MFIAICFQTLNFRVFTVQTCDCVTFLFCLLFFVACLFYFVRMSGNTPVWTLDMQKSIGRTHCFFLTLGCRSLSHRKILFSKHQSAISERFFTNKLDLAETSTQSKQSGLYYYFSAKFCSVMLSSEVCLHSHSGIGFWSESWIASNTV